MIITEEEAIVEQLARGNKCQSLDYHVHVDLKTGKKTETIRADFERLLLPEESDPIYMDDALNWLEEYKVHSGVIYIRGRHGQIASVPYCRKDIDLPKVMEVFNK